MTGNSIFLKTAKKRIVFVSPSLLLFFPFVLSLLAFPFLSLVTLTLIKISGSK